MASVLPSVVDESLFQCRLCCRSATDPRLLQCLHVFCRICLLRHVARLRHAAAAQHQTAVAQDEPRVSLEAADKFPSSAVSRPCVEDGLPASTEGQPAVAATGSALQASSPLVVSGDYDEYEVPPTNDYEDVDSDRTYANPDVTVSASDVVATGQGYAVMGSKPLSFSPQMTQAKPRAKSPALDDPSTGSSASSSRRAGRVAPPTPTPGVDLEHGSAARRLCSVSSTATYVQPSALTPGDGIYENSDADDLDFVSDDVKRRFRKKQNRSGSSKNVRRWKMNELLSTPPRLIRKLKNVDEAKTESQEGHRKLTTSHSADELSGGREYVGKSKVAVERPQQRSEANRFSYIYGSVSDDDGDPDGGGDRTSKLETLDRLIPVYEMFKSATSQRNSDHYTSIDDLDDEPGAKVYDVERRTTDVVYEVAAPLPEIDNRLTPAAAHHQSDVEMNADLPAVDPMNSFPCPVCEELSSVSLEENDGGTCGFVSAMQELIVSQAVNSRTCGNCSAPPRDGERRAAASWRCLDCRSDLCGPCHDAHTSLRLRHRVVSITDLQTGRHQGEISAALAMPCRRHPDRDGTSLCLDCGSVVVCGECRRDGEPHAGHRVTEQLDDVAARQRDFIGTLLEDTSRHLNELKDNGRVIAEYQKQFEADREDVIHAINSQRDNVVRLIDEFCANLIARVRQEYEFETDNVRDLVAAQERTCSLVDHASKVARQLVEHGRPVDVVTLSPVVRASLLAAARASPVPIDAKLVVNFRPRAVDVDDVEPIVGSVDVDRLPSSDSAANDGVLAAADSSRRGGGRRRRGSSSNKGSVSSRDAGPPTPATVGTNLSNTSAVVHEPVLLSSFPAGTPTDSKGCKPTAVAVAPSDEDSDRTTLIVVVDDINKKVKVFNDGGQLQLEICPEGRRRLVDPWDVAVLRQQRPFGTTHGAGTPAGTGRYVVTDRGAKDIKVFSATGEFVSSFGPHLSSPWGVCTNAARQVLVSDSGHRTVFIHDSAGILLFNVESFKHTANGSRYYLQCPEYVAVSPVNGDVVVTDFERHTVVVFDKFGRLITSYSGVDNSNAVTPRSGLTDRNRLRQKRILEVPCGVAVSGQTDDGRIYVADYNNRRVVRLSRNCRYDGCFVAPGTSSSQLVQPQALDFAADGRLVVVDRTHVKIFDVGVRPSPADEPADRGPSGTAETPTTPPPSSVEDSAVDSSNTEHTAAKPKPKKTGPKPVVPPRPKYLKDLTFSAAGDQAQKARAKTARSTSSPSLSVAVTAATTTPSSTAATTRSSRRPSTTSVMSQTPTKETEVW